MTKRVGVSACSASKQGEDEPARTFKAMDLYDSWLFDGRMKALEAHCEYVCILSAEHGHVDLDDELSYYDQRIDELPKKERRKLAREVVKTLPADADEVMILMGRDYAEPLKAELPDNIDVWDPLEGVGLFDQRGELRDLAADTKQTMLITDGGTGD